MTSHKVPTSKDIKAAAQAAAETAQSVASGAMRIPPASIQLASQLPGLIENLAIATERLKFRPEATRCVGCQARWDRLNRRSA